VLAAAMVCGTCLPVMAEDTSSSTTTPSPKIEVIKKFEVGANNHATDVKFTFEAKPASVDTGTKIGVLNVYGGLALSESKSKVTYAYSSASDIADTSGIIVKNGSYIDFSEVATKATAVGVYRYTVSETTETTLSGSGANEHIYSKNPWDTSKSIGSNEYTVDVYVLPDNDNGGYYIGYIKLSYPNIDDSKPSSLTFWNVCDTTTLTIQKKVTGNAGDPNKKFKFYICIPEGGKTLTLSANTKFTGKIYDSEGNFIKSKDISVEGEYTNANGLTGRSTFTTNEFELSDGQYMEITGLPVGMIYFVREEVYDEYTTTVDYYHTGSRAGQGQSIGDQPDANVVFGHLNDETNKVIYYNNLEANIVDGGVTVEVLPYVLIVAVALAGCLVLLFKKRRTVR
jgi:hypothetical protein